MEEVLRTDNHAAIYTSAFAEHFPVVGIIRLNPNLFKGEYFGWGSFRFTSVFGAPRRPEEGQG